MTTAAKTLSLALSFGFVQEKILSKDVEKGQEN